MTIHPTRGLRVRGQCRCQHAKIGIREGVPALDPYRAHGCCPTCLPCWYQPLEDPEVPVRDKEDAKWKYRETKRQNSTGMVENKYANRTMGVHA